MVKLITINKKQRTSFMSRFSRGQRGQTLIEALIALAILGIVAVAFLTALTTSSVAMVLAEQKTMAESLTRTEFEKVKDGQYPATSYTTATDGYDIQVDAEFIDPVDHSATITDKGLQLITIEIQHQGKTLLVSSDYNVR